MWKNTAFGAASTGIERNGNAAARSGLLSAGLFWNIILALLSSEAGQEIFVLPGGLLWSI